MNFIYNGVQIRLERSKVATNIMDSEVQLKPEVREVLVESLLSSGKVWAEEKHSLLSTYNVKVL